MNSQNSDGDDDRAPLVLHIGGHITPGGRDIGLQIRCSRQGPIELRIHTEDLEYVIGLVRNLGCEAKRRQPALAGTGAVPSQVKWSSSSADDSPR